jgi:hypothetical protein
VYLSYFPYLGSVIEHIYHSTTSLLTISLSRVALAYLTVQVLLLVMHNRVHKLALYHYCEQLTQHLLRINVAVCKGLLYQSKSQSMGYSYVYTDTPSTCSIHIPILLLHRDTEILLSLQQATAQYSGSGTAASRFNTPLFLLLALTYHTLERSNAIYHNNNNIGSIYIYVSEKSLGKCGLRAGMNLIVTV